jgi:hypothetical protein
VSPAREDGHQRRDHQRRLVREPAPVQQRGPGITERAEHHGPGTEKFAAQVDAQQGDDAGEADDQTHEPLAVRDLGPG